MAPKPTLRLRTGTNSRTEAELTAETDRISSALRTAHKPQIRRKGVGGDYCAGQYHRPMELRDQQAHS
jgi:hypothetical protein